jgi:formylglycine-generating enzyme required for sulfatase activity
MAMSRRLRALMSFVMLGCGSEQIMFSTGTSSPATTTTGPSTASTSTGTTVSSGGAGGLDGASADATADGPAGSGGASPEGASDDSPVDGAGSEPGDVTNVVPPGPSCIGLAPCRGESCCTAIDVPAGTFPQGRSTTAGASDEFASGKGTELPEHASTVSTFALDKYEVTVGRIRKFIDAYVSNTTTVPANGAGANPAIAGTGWQSAWNANLPATQAALRSDLTSTTCTAPTWTDAPGANENKAINCTDWYVSFAFCIWDGGRLATESEWEYAAAGGSDNRLYPWGATAPDCTYANFGGCFGLMVDEVGARSNGNAKWGHADMAGNVMEWTLDWFAAYSASSTTNYADIVPSSGRIVRGSYWGLTAAELRAAARGSGLDPQADGGAIGLRCARSAP